MPAKKKLAESLSSSIETQSSVPEPYFEESVYVNNEFDKQIRLEELNTIRGRNESENQNRTQRREYAGKIFGLTIGWSVLIFVTLFLKGSNLLALSDKIIITLITSTTINLFGFFYVVTRYLFNAGGAKIKK